MSTKTPPQTYWLLFSLYITQYLPVAFFTSALPAIIMTEGGELSDLTFIYLLGMIWSLKFFWAPLIDRFSPGKQISGHYRRWLIILQSCLVLLIALCAILSVQMSPVILASITILICFVAASQDVASDALAVNLLDDHNRGTGNGIQSAGGLVGQMVGGGVILMLYPHLGWSLSLIVLALMVLFPLYQVSRFKEPEDFRNKETANYKYMAGILKNSRTIYLLIANAILYTSIMVSFGFLIPSLIQSGWNMEKVGLATNIIGPLFGILAALACGFIIRKKGVTAGLAIVVVVQLLVSFTTINLLSVSEFWRFTICILQLVSFGVTACFVFTSCMKACDQHNGGSTFSLLVCLITLTASGVSAVSMNIAQAYGMDNIRYILAAGAVVAAVIFLLGAGQSREKDTPSLEDASEAV